MAVIGDCDTKCALIGDCDTKCVLIGDCDTKCVLINDLENIFRVKKKQKHKMQTPIRYFLDWIRVSGKVSGFLSKVSRILKGTTRFVQRHADLNKKLFLY